MSAIFKYLFIALWAPALITGLVVHFSTDWGLVPALFEGASFFIAFFSLVSGAIKWDEWSTVGTIATKITSLSQGPHWQAVLLRVAFPWSHLKVYRADFSCPYFSHSVIISKKDLAEGQTVLMLREGHKLYFAQRPMRF